MRSEGYCSWSVCVCVCVFVVGDRGEREGKGEKGKSPNTASQLSPHIQCRRLSCKIYRLQYCIEVVTEVQSDVHE